MAKPDSKDERERVRTSIYRIVPVKGKDGSPIPGKWNTEEVVIEGVVAVKLVHESAQPLAVARERYFALERKRTQRPEPEKW